MKPINDRYPVSGQVFEIVCPFLNIEIFPFSPLSPGTLIENVKKGHEKCKDTLRLSMFLHPL